MSNSAAEEKKAVGNKAFAAKDYDQAVACYTEAIQLDPTNHVYFSNRSASHGGNKEWDKAAKDAKECIRLDPTFIKGYYRLATAQIELADWDAALSTIKQGLAADPDNSQLTKQLRIVKAKRASKRASPASSSSGMDNAIIGRLPGTVDASVSKEFRDLQEQLITTSRELNMVKANIAKSQKEKRIMEVTKSELEKDTSDSSARMYQSVGKMFMLSSRSEIFEQLDKTIVEEGKSVADLSQKVEYLERRMKSQQQNMQELIKVPSAE